MAFNIFESTNMGSSNFAERILDAVATSDIENGTFGYLVSSATEGELPTFTKGFKAGEKIVVVDAPAWTETMVNSQLTQDKRKDKFINEAGVPFRVRVIKNGDTFATAIEGITSASQSKAKYGAYLTIDSTTGKLVASATSTYVAATESAGAKIPVFEAVVDEVRTTGATLVTSARTYGRDAKMYQATVKYLG